jgi:hypothetical protein
VARFPTRLGSPPSYLQDPSTGQLRKAAGIWHQLANASKLKYAFVGSIAAILNGEVYAVDHMEILIVADRFCPQVEQSVETDLVLDPAETKVVDTKLIPVGLQAGGVGYTSKGECVLLIDGHRGIALKFIPTGRFGHQDELVFPSHSIETEPFDRKPNVRLLRIDVNSEQVVPVLRSHMLLVQRLVRFNPDSEDHEERIQNERDATDIRAFLKISAADLTERWSDELAQRMLPLVTKWIPYARARLVPTDDEDWRRLGVSLDSSQDVTNNNQMLWICGGDSDLSHRREIGSGGFGDVHEVQTLSFQ